MEGMNIESIKKELEDIWTSNVKNDVFADNPLDYACSLSGFLKEYVPDHIEAGKYSDANENVTDVYLKTEVW
ncbi:MAG: hypothetical protein LUD50_03675, partial [Clostridia bacterium]|nr:hypothetical protein [Clostridia bacterium]